ncbi:MAG: protein kinase [Polyangiaceae bacterium]|nr:protein kinase [Polyangiaceae bacterium]
MSTAVEDEDLERWRARVGTTIRGKWTLDSLLGVGGMAAVYAATHKIGRRDAIKILHPEVAVSRELRSRFQQEALAVGKLGHPGAVQVLDIDMTEDGSPFLVMELLDGENLGQLAYRLGSIPERELLGYVDQLLDVLGAAHALGIIHRDIKPDNVFITRDGRVKVLDFGIAQMKRGGSGLKTRTGAMMGTTSYMAPEQIHGQAIDGRTDIFAVGATMFRILAKRKLHEANTDADLLVKMGTTPAPAIASVAQVSAPTARIVDTALAFDAARRYPDAAAMRADVQAALGELPAVFFGGPVSAPMPSIPREATGATHAAPYDPALAAIAARTAAPTAAPIEPTSLPMVIAQPTVSKTVPDNDRPPLVLFAAIGGVMLLLGVGFGTWFMLGRDGASASDRAVASRSSEDDAAETSAEERAAPDKSAEPTTPTGDPSSVTPSTDPKGDDPPLPATGNPAVPSKPTGGPIKSKPPEKKKPDKKKGKGKWKGDHD